MREGIEGRYDYSAKDLVRDHWVPFAGTGLSREVIEKLIVWFLPGPQALEVPQYLKRGFRVNQLAGFEWDKRRADAIRSAVPSLPLVPSALRVFLDNPKLKISVPDWANLDFDGSALTFGSEVRETIRRLRLDRAPRLGLSSLGSRDRSALIEAIKTLSIWAAMCPNLFSSGTDLLRRNNNRDGLVLTEPIMTYMLCRELAVSLLLLRAFGERAYSEEDAKQAEDFTRAFAAIEEEADQKARPLTEERLGRPVAIPIVELSGVRELFASRQVPVRLGDRLRFVYRSLSEKHWRWAWYFRFTAVQNPGPLTKWAETLLMIHPPLHVIDFTGAVIGNRAQGVCEFCTKERRNG